MQIIRWLIVPIAAASLVVGCAIAARAVVAAADEHCAQPDMVGGTCIAPWHTNFVEWVIYLGVGLTAFTVTTIPAMIAPGLRRSISIACWLLINGATTALFVTTGWLDLQMPLLIALLLGALGVIVIWKQSGTHHHVTG